jgi:hypothetical protein
MRKLAALDSPVSRPSIEAALALHQRGRDLHLHLPSGEKGRRVPAAGRRLRSAYAASPPALGAVQVAELRRNDAPPFLHSGQECGEYRTHR